jgi:hypothetical protein
MTDSPQRRAADTRMDRKQLAALSAGLDELRAENTALRADVDTMLSMVRDLLRLTREVLDRDEPPARPGSGRPVLRGIAGGKDPA